MADTKKFLSYEGLETFWGLIQTKLAGSLDLTVDNTAGATITLKDVKGNTLSEKTIAIATASEAGLMSPDQVSQLNSMVEDVENSIKLNGVAFNGNAATIKAIGSGENVKDKHVNLDFKYEDTQIKLVDLNNVVDGKPTVLTSIDASDFVKDGILENVTWGEGENSNKLIFEFKVGVDGTHTESIAVDLSKFIDVYTAAANGGIAINSDKEVSIKLADGETYLTVDTDGLHTTQALADAIAAKANAADVYTKTEVDGFLGDKADADAVYTKTEIDGKVETLEGAIDKKANAADVYTKTEVDGFLGDKADADAVYTKTEVDGFLGDKADADTVYTKTEIDGKVEALEGAIDKKADADAVYTKTEVDGFLGDKADADAVYTKTEVDGFLGDKADADAVYTKTEIDGKVEALEGAIDKKADADAVYTKTEVDGLLADKADADAVYTKTEVDGLLADKADADSVYTKTEIDGKVEALEGAIDAFIPITTDEITAIVNGTANA